METRHTRKVDGSGCILFLVGETARLCEDIVPQKFRRQNPSKMGVGLFFENIQKGELNTGAEA